MSKKNVQALSEKAGIPCVHMGWPEGSAPDLPYMVFYLDRQSGLYADNVTFNKSSRWVVELYQRRSDEELEQRLEDAIEESFGPVSKSEWFVEQENCMQTTYYFKEN